MGNRSRFLAVSVGAAAAAVAAARRRARWRRAAEGLHETILPTAAAPGVSDAGRDDEAHASGHRHLPFDGGARPRPVRLRGRPWTKHDHGLRQSGTG